MLDTDLNVFLTMITAPLRAAADRSLRVKFGKVKKRLNVMLRETTAPHPFKYNPNRHNVYYIRSKRMLQILMHRLNLQYLRESNPQFIAIFCIDL